MDFFLDLSSTVEDFCRCWWDLRTREPKCLEGSPTFSVAFRRVAGVSIPFLSLLKGHLCMSVTKWKRCVVRVNKEKNTL